MIGPFIAPIISGSRRLKPPLGCCFSVTVNGATASGFLSHSIGQVSLGEIFNGNHTAGTFYLDAVPEPAGLWALGCGVLLASRRRPRRP